MFISLLGICFGIISGSFSIVFDGVYSLVDACMSLLSLVVARLIAAAAAIKPVSKKLQERFSMGLWHLEPMVLCLNGTLLSVLRLMHCSTQWAASSTVDVSWSSAGQFSTPWSR